MKNYFRGFSVEHISRSKNAKTDELANAATRKITMPPPPDVFIQTLEDSLIKTIE
jgi:hypothetical protein